jgi:hypothetical protein
MIYNPVYLPSFTLSQIVGTRDKMAPSLFCVEKNISCYSAWSWAFIGIKMAPS